MDMRSAVARLVVVVGLALPLVSCNFLDELQAMKRFKEANILYQRQDYQNALVAYEEVVAENPEMTVAYFYLANSYDNLYKPSRRGEPENDAYLERAVENYKIAVEREEDSDRRKLAMQYLVAAYGPDKFNDPNSSEPVLQQMILLDPDDPANYYTLAKLYEDAGCTSWPSRRSSEYARSDPMTRWSISSWRASTSARESSSRRSRP